MKIAWGTPTRHGKTGNLGARMFMRIDGGKWHGHYEIDTHEKSSTEIAAAILDLQARHDRWSSRIDELQKLGGVELQIGAQVYRIVGCTIPPRSHAEHDLIVGVRRVDGGALRRVEGWPLVIRLRSIDECPSNDGILSAVTEKLGIQRSVSDAHQEFVEKVAQKLS